VFTIAETEIFSATLAEGTGRRKSSVIFALGLHSIPEAGDVIPRSRRLS